MNIQIIRKIQIGSQEGPNLLTINPGLYAGTVTERVTEESLKNLWPLTGEWAPMGHPVRAEILIAPGVSVEVYNYPTRIQFEEVGEPLALIEVTTPAPALESHSAECHLWLAPGKYLAKIGKAGAEVIAGNQIWWVEAARYKILNHENSAAPSKAAATIISAVEMGAEFSPSIMDQNPGLKAELEGLGYTIEEWYDTEQATRLSISKK